MQPEPCDGSRDRGHSKKERQSVDDKPQDKLDAFHQANRDLLNPFYRTVVESSQDAIIGQTLDGIVSSWNRAAETIYGFSAAEMVGQPIARLVPPERSDELADLRARLLRGESIGRFETQRLTKDGRRLHVAMTLSVVYDVSGRMVGVASIDRDITEHVQATEAHARLAAIVESSEDIIVSKTLQGIITSWNQGAMRILGYTAEEMIGRSVTTFIPEDRQGEEAMILGRLSRGERIEHYETVRRHKDGRLIDVSLTISPIRDKDGRVIGASKIARDISFRKQAEELLRQANQQLEQQVAERTVHLNGLVRSLEGVCYTMAHDLRSPLRSLQSFAEILLRDHRDRLDPDGRTCAERIVAAAARMNLLIRDLLEFAKMGHLDLPCEPLDVETIIERVLENLGSEIHTRGAEVVLRRGKVPSVRANRTVLEQVFANLVGNALKFVPTDVRPRVEISTEIIDPFVRVSLKDNGIGIEPRHQDRIYGLFQRLHSNEAYPGTGVGLAIVKRGLERVGGRISLRSELGRGSTFMVDLPLAV